LPLELELLSPDTHRHLGIRAGASGAPHFVQIVASEFASAAACCPILLTKNAGTGQFYAGAMFGFEPGENLLGEAGADGAVFTPLDLERQGFYISGESIAVDRNHPRFSTTDGEPLFDENGQPRERLRHIQRVLGALKIGVDETDAFIAALLQHRLVEPIDVDLSFDDGKSLSLQGLYTVSLDSLGQLDDATALQFFRRGYLQLAYVMAASLKQISALALRRNRRLTA
jgi:hypothetical protein